MDMHNKTVAAAALCLIALTAYAEKSVVIDNVRYEILKNKSGVSCRAEKSKELVDLEIPARVKIDGRFYPVISVEPKGFQKCRNLKSLVLPSTVETIGTEAFWDCIGLETAVMPDAAESAVTEGSFGFGRHGIFKGCKSLKRLRGTTMMYPQYILLDAVYNCPEIPVYASLQAVSPNDIDKVVNFDAKFSSFIKENYLPQIEAWQKRKGYETVAQWESRVNEKNRQRMVDEAVSEARKEFLKTYAPVSARGTLEEYDSDHQLYPVYMGDLGTIYASVPREKAESFAASWRDVKIEPVYGVIDDGVGIVSCKFFEGDDAYESPRSFAEDDFEAFVTQLTPLASLREYEAQLAARETKAEERKVYAPDTVDIDIPAAAEVRDRTFAVIIGNENYQRVANVDYAQNDARVLAKYCHRTLGIPESNIRTYYDATYGDMVAALEDIKNVTDAFNGDAEVIFYYAGHGLPDESNRSAYLLPVDANGTTTESCYPMSKLYEQLGQLKARHTVALMDACFSGSLRGEGMLASARGVKMRPREVPAQGNLIVISAASGDQTAYPYSEKNHGLFSYYLLKKLQETGGDVTLGDLSDYLRDNVSQQSILVNRKPQKPTLKYSLGLTDTWSDIKL